METGNVKNWTVGQLMEMAEKFGIKFRGSSYGRLQELVEDAMRRQ